jgi:hypothetical protein
LGNSRLHPTITSKIFKDIYWLQGLTLMLQLYGIDFLKLGRGQENVSKSNCQHLLWSRNGWHGQISIDREQLITGRMWLSVMNHIFCSRLQSKCCQTEQWWTCEGRASSAACNIPLKKFFFHCKWSWESSSLDGMMNSSR